MLMEGWVTCLSPQNTVGVSGVNSVAAKVTSSDTQLRLDKVSFTPCFNPRTRQLEVAMLALT